MKIKLALLESDKLYLSRLVSSLSTKYMDKLEIYSFTAEETAYSVLEANKINVFLAAENFQVDRTKIPQNCGFAYLVSTGGVNEYRNEVAINKFQKIDLLYKQILDIFSEAASDITGMEFANNTGNKVISFLSASGGTGASSVAAACAMAFAQNGKKVLYLNLEQFGSADVYFAGEGNGSFGDIIYAIKSKKGNLSMKLESTVKQDKSGVFFYSATKVALDMAELSAEEIRELIANIRIHCEYEYIILDMDFSLEKSVTEIWKECSQIVFVNDGSPSSNMKLRRVITAMQILEEQNDWSLLDKCNILYNRFSSKTSQIMECEEVKELGGIKRFEGYEVAQLLEQLSQNEIFTRLL